MMTRGQRLYEHNRVAVEGDAFDEVLLSLNPNEALLVTPGGGQEIVNIEWGRQVGAPVCVREERR